jgi:hypothetical protein
MFHDPVAAETEASEHRPAKNAKALDLTHEKDHLNQCKYLPTSLDNEPDETLAQQLDFLSEPFTFARDQLDIFFRTLADRLKAQPDPDASVLSGSMADETMDVSGAPDAPITVED